ncbi:MAG: ABC transporter ATP-binding protein [Pseudobdellovibrio sp.]
MVKIRNLGFSFNDKKLFQNFNLSLKPSAFLLIRGPSGCGKSTLLKLIAGFIPPQSGQIEIEKSGLKIGYLHQDCHLIEHWSVNENLKLVSSEQKLIDELLGHFGLQNINRKLVQNLSGGEKQRVSLIRILLQKPDLALLDEPTAHLDDKNTANIIEFIKEYLKDKIVIIVSHDHRIDSMATQIHDWKNLVTHGN